MLRKKVRSSEELIWYTGLLHDDRKKKSKFLHDSDIVLTGSPLGITNALAKFDF